VLNDPNHKGNIAEAAITLAATKLGIPVLRPITEHTRYDMIFDLEPGLVRVQCKWAPRKGNVVVVNLAGFRYTSTGYVRSTYCADEIDAVAAYCQELDECYLLPIEKVDGMRGIHLRLAPTKNGQRAALNWAADYRLGAVAQLEERRGGTAKVRGSSPLSSTSNSTAENTLGIDIFRQRFGWYMERAKAGEEFLITRRGRPHARLAPPPAFQPQLESR
jgi:prevent-host-death family protein